jgi:hypothetical protein
MMNRRVSVFDVIAQESVGAPVETRRVLVRVANRVRGEVMPTIVEALRSAADRSAAGVDVSAELRDIASKIQAPG